MEAMTSCEAVLHPRVPALQVSIPATQTTALLNHNSCSQRQTDNQIFHISPSDGAAVGSSSQESNKDQEPAEYRDEEIDAEIQNSFINTPTKPSVLCQQNSVQSKDTASNSHINTDKAIEFIESGPDTVDLSDSSDAGDQNPSNIIPMFEIERQSKHIQEESASVCTSGVSQEGNQEVIDLVTIGDTEGESVDAERRDPVSREQSRKRKASEELEQEETSETIIVCIILEMLHVTFLKVNIDVESPSLNQLFFEVVVKFMTL